MQWDELEPVVKVVPRAQAHIRVNKDGKPRVWLFLSETLLKETGAPKKCDVQIGADEAGICKLRLAFKKDGRFTIKDMGRGGARVCDIPAKAPMPDGSRETEVCDVETSDATQAIFLMPLKAWEAQLTPKPVSTVVAAQLKAGPAVASNGNGGNGNGRAKLDAVQYLGTRGVGAKRQGDHFIVNGEVQSKASTLTIVNRYRRAVGLDALGMMEIY